MVAITRNTMDTGLPAIPETSDQKLFYELIKIYNAIAIVSQGLDSYTQDGGLVTGLAGKVPLDGTGATGVWGISITGNAGTVTTVSLAQVLTALATAEGTAVLVAGTKVVLFAGVTATSNIQLTSQIDGGTPGFLRVSARVPGTSFTILSSNLLDTSTIGYQIH